MVLTEQQSSLLGSLYNWLQQCGMLIVPLQPVAETLKHQQHLQDEYSMNLNLAPNYAASFQCDDRELVQNFRDRCA